MTIKTPMPAWLLKQLEDQGRIVNGITRAARIRTCPTCRHTTITGLDADLAALPAIVDPSPLTSLSEAFAIMAGRITYALVVGRGGRLELDHRTSFHIAGKRQVDVLATHVCNTSPLPSQPSVYQRTVAAPAGSEPPF